MKKILLAISLVCITSALLAQCTTLFLTHMGAGAEAVTIYTTAAIPAGTNITLTDNEWNGSGFSGGEGYVTWTSPTTGEIPANTYVELTGLTGTPSSSCGTGINGSGSFALANSNDEVFVYFGTDAAPPTVITDVCFAGQIGGGTFGGTAPTGAGAVVDVGSANDWWYTATGNTASDFENASNWSSSISSVNITGATDGCDGFLPVSINSFTAKLMDSKTVSLDWSTASEENNTYFSIEHSTNGHDFADIDQVEGAINSSEIQYYSYYHKEAESGMNYYRLRQVDTDGTFSFSPIQAVRLASDAAIEVYPTLAKEEVQVFINEGLDNEATVEIYNVLGRLLISEILERGATQTSIPVHNLQKGHYVVKLTNGSEFQISRFIKE